MEKKMFIFSLGNNFFLSSPQNHCFFFTFNVIFYPSIFIQKPFLLNDKQKKLIRLHSFGFLYKFVYVFLTLYISICIFMIGHPIYPVLGGVSNAFFKDVGIITRIRFLWLLIFVSYFEEIN